MKQIFIATAVLASGILAAGEAAAQNASDLNRQMEVTRAYEPTVDRATKFDIEPEMVDTVSLKPDISYRVNPNPISYGFETTPIKAAGVSTLMPRRLTPLYIKAGLGYPFQSLLDAYYTSTGNPDSRFGAYVNHYGSWSKIKNDAAVKAPASMTNNKLSVFGEHRFGRLGIDGEIGYDYDMYSRYGYSYAEFDQPLDDTGASALRQNFSTLRGSVNFGNSFEDLSYFNFRIGGDVAYFKDKFDMAETDFKVYLALGKLFNDRHEITLRAGYDGYKGSKNLDYSDNIFTVTPRYRLNTGKFDFSIGFTYTYNSQSFDLRGDGSDRHKSYFFPQLDLKMDIANGYFIPYVQINGGLRNNGYRSTSRQNPYVLQGLFMPDTEEYNGRAGIAGNISSSFSYKVYAGATIYKRLNMFANFYDSALYADVESARNLFVFLTDNATMYTFGGDIEGRISGSFGVEASFQYFGYDMKNLDKAGGMPNMAASLGLKYSYRDKLVVTLGGDFTGRRYFFEIPDLSLADAYEVVKQKGVVDLNLGAEYNISPKTGVFLNLNNLLNQKLYPYNHYPHLGISAMAGVKVSF